MKKNWKNDLDLLIYSLDNELTEAEQAQLDTALVASAILREERRKYLKMKTLVADLSFSESPQFAEQVLQKWKDRQPRNNFQQQLIQLFPRVAAAAILVFFTLWLGIQYAGITMDLEGVLLVGAITPDEAIQLLSKCN